MNGVGKDTMIHDNLVRIFRVAYLIQHAGRLQVQIETSLSQCRRCREHLQNEPLFLTVALSVYSIPEAIGSEGLKTYRSDLEPSMRGDISNLVGTYVDNTLRLEYDLVAPCRTYKP